MRGNQSVFQQPDELLPGGQIGRKQTLIGWKVGGGVPGSLFFLDSNSMVVQSAPMLTISSRGDIVWTPQSGTGAYGSAVNKIAAASVSRPVDGAIILDGTQLKFYQGSAWHAVPLTSGPAWDFSVVTASVTLTADTTKIYSRVINGLTPPAVNVTLPNPAVHIGQPIYIKVYNFPAGGSKIVRYGTEKINGAAGDYTLGVAPGVYDSVIMMSDGTDWWFIGGQIH